MKPMAWIDTINETEASGDLKDAYDALDRQQKKIANILRVHSLNTGAMERQMSLYTHLMFGKSGLSRADRESIAVVVSAANNCGYCVSHHAEALSHYERDNSRLRRMVSDFQFLDLPDKKARMLSYALKLTTSPSQVSDEDIQELKDVGYSDRDILDMNLIASYFNFLNRVALGLGVDCNEEEPAGRSDDHSEDNTGS
jgi:uncharacterized peroxidase-related enzyme